MKFKKVIPIVFFLCLTITSTYAESILNNWEKVTSNKEYLKLYIDFDSFIYYNNNVFYIAKYDDLIKQKQNVVYIVSNCNENKAAILFSEKYNPQKKYTIQNINKYYPTFKTIKNDAAIFELHNIACVFKKNNNITDKNIDFMPYMRELQRTIKMNWVPPKGTESKHVIVYMIIAKNGELISARIHKSSGSSRYDSAALEAVKLTAPFRPLPPEYNQDSIAIQFTFDYNVFGNKSY